MELGMFCCFVDTCIICFLAAHDRVVAEATTSMLALCLDFSHCAFDDTPVDDSPAEQD